MTRVFDTSRGEDVLLVLPCLLGLALAGIGLVCFRAAQPVGLRRIVTALWVGWGCGAVATGCAKLPVLPEALDSTLAKISFPVWVVMGSLSWLFLSRLVLVQAAPVPLESAPPSREHKLLCGLALLPLAGVTIAALMVLFGPGA